MSSNNDTPSDTQANWSDWDMTWGAAFRSSWEVLDRHNENDNALTAAFSNLHLAFDQDNAQTSQVSALLDRYELLDRYSTMPRRLSTRARTLSSSMMFDAQWDAMMSAIYDGDDYEFNLMLGELMGKVECGVVDIAKVVTPVSVEEAAQSGNDCPICFEAFPNLESTGACKTECNHYFCSPCITKWLGSNKKCPICMHDLDAATGNPV